MNPYIERSVIFHDFHQQFAVFAVGHLADQVTPRYTVETDQEIYIHEPSADERRFARPDIYISEDDATVPLAQGTRLKAPAAAEIPQSIDEIGLNNVLIRDKDDRSVVTVIELLSPTNKIERDHRHVYVARRRKLLSEGVNLVEIDLLRQGDRMPMTPTPHCDYLVSVARASDRPRVEVWPFNVRSRVPMIPVPLRPSEADAYIDIKHLIDTVYDSARYRLKIYRGLPEPPLAGDDAAWAAEIAKRESQ
jgi:hypothetical protein